MSDWAVYGFDLGSSGKNPVETILTLANYASLIVAPGWPVTLDGAVVSQVLIVGAYAYVTTRGGTFYKLDAITGAVVGSYSIGGAHVPSSSTPHILAGVAYFGADDGYLYAVNTTTMALVWRSNVQDATPIVCDVIASGTRVFYGSVGGTFHAALISTGNESWNKLALGPITGPLGVNGSFVYVPHGTGVSEIALTGGAQYFYRSRAGAAGVAIQADPGQTYLVFSCLDQWTYAYDLATKSRIWMDLQSGQLKAAVGLDFAAGLGYAVIGTHNFSIQPHTYWGGFMRWKRDGTASAAIVAGFTIANGILFGVWPPKDGRLCAWQLDDSPGGHTPGWRFGTFTGINGADDPANAGNYCTPSVVNGRVYWAADNAKAYCFALP